MKLNVGDGRGTYKKHASEKNRRDIIEFFKNNPGATRRDCADFLKLSYITVGNHVRAIQGEK